MDRRPPKPTSPDRSLAGGRTRRRFLGLAGAAATASTLSVLSGWTGTTAATADWSFDQAKRWRETLPTAGWDSRNHLLLQHDSFSGEPGSDDRWQTTRATGSAAGLTVGEGQLELWNATDRPTSATITTPVSIAAPWVAVAATVNELPSTGFAGLGFASPDDDWVGGEIGPDGIQLRYRFNGQETVESGRGDPPSVPFEALAILMGDRLSLLTREPTEDWVYRGDLAWRSRRTGVDLYDHQEWARWDPALRVEAAPNRRAAFGDCRVAHLLQFGLRDPTVVTYPDGTPLVRDGELYLTATCGSVDHRGYQVVLGLDVETYDVSMHAALWAESVPGYVSNYVAGHLMYDPDPDEFRLCWSGFGNGPMEPYRNQKCWISRTGADVLRGTHVLDCELMQLPWGWSGRQHDPFVVRDRSAGAWRCVHSSESIHRITVSETTDDDLTSGWTTVASYRDLFNQIEGGKLARVDGEIVLSYADQGSPGHMVTARYPDPSKDRRRIDVDVPPGDAAPHPSIVTVPTDQGPKQLLLTMDGATVFGLGESSHGALCVYERRQ